MVDPEAAPHPPMQSLAEILRSVQIHANTHRIMNYAGFAKYPELIAVVAIHIGLADTPDVEIPYPGKILDIFSKRVVIPARDRQEKERVFGRPPTLDEIDKLILNHLVPEQPLSQRALTYKSLRSLVESQKQLGPTQITETELDDRVKYLFETKLPDLLDRRVAQLK